MNSKNLIGWVIALAVLAGPFRWTYLDMDNDHDAFAVLSFLMVLAGFYAAYVLTQNKNKA